MGFVLRNEGLAVPVSGVAAGEPTARTGHALASRDSHLSSYVPSLETFGQRGGRRAALLKA